MAVSHVQPSTVKFCPLQVDRVDVVGLIIRFMSRPSSVESKLAVHPVLGTAVTELLYALFLHVTMVLPTLWSLALSSVSSGVSAPVTCLALCVLLGLDVPLLWFFSFSLSVLHSFLLCPFPVAPPALLRVGGGRVLVSFPILFVGVDHHGCVVGGRSSLVHFCHILELLSGEFVGFNLTKPLQ